MCDVLDEIKYVKQAEEVIKNLKKSGNLTTTTQMRKILSLLNDIYSDVVNSDEKDYNKRDKYLRERLVYFKMRCVYEAGRNEKKIRNFIEDSNLLNYVDDIINVEDGQHDVLLKKFITLFHYMEALVAYHRYSGGRD